MKISEVINELLLILLDFAVMYMLLDINLAKVKKAKLFFSSIILAISLILSVYVAFRYGRTTFHEYFPILVQLPFYILFYAISEFKRAKFFFVFLSTYILSSPVIWSPFIVGAFVNYSNRIMILTTVITYLIMFVVIKKFIASLFHYALENLNSSWILLSLLPIFYSILSYLADENNHTLSAWKETSYFRVLILAIIYTSYMVVFIFFKQIREQFLLKNEQTALKLQMSAMKDHLSALIDSQTMASIYKHDLRHHLQYINTCLLQANYEESSNYIMSICNEIEESSVFHYCENDNVNMILSSYITRAKNSGIDFVVDAIIPTTIDVATTDLCAVLANGIENAIVACEKLQDKEKKKIHLSSYIKNGKIFLQIINPYDEVIEFQKDLPISHYEGHGLGTKSIVNIVTKYKGIFSFVAKDNLFTLTVII